MTREEKNWIIETVTDFIIGEIDLHKCRTFHITAYANPDEYRIPVLFSMDDQPVQHLVVDFEKKRRVQECEGINDCGEYIRLNCDLINAQEIGYINYYQNEDLSKVLNERLSPQSDS